MPRYNLFLEVYETRNGEGRRKRVIVQGKEEEGGGGRKLIP